MPAQDIPLLPDAAVDALAKQPLQRAQQELRRLLGFSGDVLDMAVTYRAMLDAGLITLGSLENVRRGSGMPPRTIAIAAGAGAAGPPGPAGPPGAGAEDPDLTPPPNVSNLAAAAGISRVVVTWDIAGYSVGHGPGQVNLYVALREPSDPLPTFGEASLFHSAPHPLVIAALSIEPNMRVHLWAKHQTVDGVESPDPAGGTNGVTVTTGQDVAALLEVLAGEIRASELSATLASRIDLIDAPSGTAGSVNARIATETSARTAADAANASSISTVSARLNSGGDTYSAIVTAQATASTANLTANTAASNITGLQAQYVVKVDVNGYVAGYGLASTAIDGIPFSDFQLRADRFSITNPNATQIAISSLTRSGTTATLTTTVAHGLVAGNTFGIRGVSNDGGWNRGWTVTTRPSTTQITFTVPSTLTTPASVGSAKLSTGVIPFIVDGGVVYMDTALIKDATITGAKIGLATITDANIANLNADKITAGFLSAARIASGTITATHIQAGTLSADNVHTRGLTVRDGSGSVILAAGTPLDYSHVAGITKPITYRVVSRGFGASYPLNGGLYNAAGTPVGAVGRSYNLTVLDRATGAIATSLDYDVYGAGASTPGRDAAALAAALDATTKSQIVVLYTYDEPLNNRLTGGLPAAIYRAGGSPGVFERSGFESRSAYLLIAPGGQPQRGNAYVEQYAGVLAYGADGPDDAWIDVSFTVANGSVVVGGGSSIHEINASNISTYIASAAIGTAQIGSVDAGTITVGTLNVDRIANGAITDAFRIEQFSLVSTPFAGAVVCSVSATPPSGSAWTGEVVFVGLVVRGAYASAMSFYLAVEAFVSGSWALVRDALHTIPATSVPTYQTVSVAAPWGPSHWPSATAWRIRIAAIDAVSCAASGSLTVRTYKK